jgi:hypothetical protein
MQNVTMQGLMMQGLMMQGLMMQNLIRAIDRMQRSSYRCTDYRARWLMDAIGCHNLQKKHHEFRDGVRGITHLNANSKSRIK